MISVASGAQHGETQRLSAPKPTREANGGRRNKRAALLELASSSGLELSPQMLAVVLELLRLDVSPQGVVQLLRSLKAARLKAAHSEPTAVA